MSSSRRKRRTTGSNRVALGLLLALGASEACRRAPQYPFLTYFDPDHAVSVRHPANWTTDLVDQDGRRYRYFLAPPVGPERKPAVSVALLADAAAGGLDAYARTYVAGQTVEATREAGRQGLPGKAWRLRSPDGATRYALLLMQEGERVYGLFGQGEAARYQEHVSAVDEMEESFTLERPARYPEHRDDKLAFSLRVPPSWQSTRNFSGGGTHLMQFTSPAFGAEGRQTVHASLTLTVEPAPAEGGLDHFYKAVRGRLGEPFRVLGHAPWKDGYLDLERAEMPMTVSRVKRFYRVHGSRGYSLAFESREDVFHRVSRWCDIIAATLKVGPEVNQP